MSDSESWYEYLNRQQPNPRSWWDGLGDAPRPRPSWRPRSRGVPPDPPMAPRGPSPTPQRPLAPPPAHPSTHRLPRPKATRFGAIGRRRRPRIGLNPPIQKAPVLPLSPNEVAMLFESLQRGRKCRESVARCRDTALIAMLLVGLSARYLLRLDVADVQAIRLPQPVWWAVLAWVRRRASIPGTIECKRLFIHAHCKPLHPRGLYLLLNRRARRAGITRPISVLAVRLARPWGPEDFVATSCGFSELGRRGAPRRRFPAVWRKVGGVHESDECPPELPGESHAAALPFAAAMELGEWLQRRATRRLEATQTGGIALAQT